LVRKREKGTWHYGIHEGQGRRQLVMEEIPARLLITALEKAVDVGSQYLHEAENMRQDNVLRCIAYLDAARAAIRGLEEELDEILIETKLVVSFPQDWEKRPDIFRRIDSYLNRDRLRPILDDSLVGIERCQRVAAANPASFFQRSSVGEQRKETVAAILLLNNKLDVYLKALSGQMDLDRIDYAGGSGLHMDELLEVERLLDDSRAGAEDAATRKEEIKGLVETMQKRAREGLPLAAEAKGLMLDLTVAFRLETLSNTAQERA
jgi:hypothetical protein